MSGIQSSKSSVLKPVAMSQTISFQDSADGSSFDVHAKEVIVRGSAGSHTSGSSKVKLKSIVDYGWESRHYPGRLVAIHMEGKYLAYGLKPLGKSVGVVRVVNRETEERVLIRDLLGLVQDLCFAHIRSQIMLASVDHFGNLFVHQIQAGAAETLECSLFLHVEYEGGQSASGLMHRVVWCPFIPEDGSQATVEDDAAKLLVVTHGCKAEMLNVARVRADIPMGEVRVRPSHVIEGRLPMDEHSGDIVEASFSPDGTALATASADGLVKFFQVYLPTESGPRCLHKWRPHGGRPLSCLFFLDDHRNHSPEVQFWKFAITGTRNNHELKLWSCESWTCLQTIYFGDKEAPRNQEEGFLKAGLDLAAKFLILSDIGRKVLYVLQFGRDEDEGISFVSTISEFHLPYPILSFGVVDAEICPRKCVSGSPTAAYTDDASGADAEGEESKGEGEENGGRRRSLVAEGEEEGEAEASGDGASTVAIHIVLVQPKSLQECHIMFEAGSSNPAYQAESTSLPLPTLGTTEKEPMESEVKGIEDSAIQTHAVSSVGTTAQMTLEPTPDGITATAPNPIAFSNVANAPILTLMTPDAFSSPIRREGVTPVGAHAGSHPTSLVSSPASTLSAPSSSGGVPDKVTPPSAPSPPHPPAEPRFPPPPPLDHPGPHSPGSIAPLSQNPHLVQTSHAFVAAPKVGGDSAVVPPLPQVPVVEKKVEDKDLVSVGAGDADRVGVVGAVGGSGGSSPSREVRQILSLSDSPRGVEHEFFDDKEVEEEEEGVIVMGQAEEEDEEEEEEAVPTIVEAAVLKQMESGVLVNPSELDIRNSQVAAAASNLPEGILTTQPPAPESLPVGNLPGESIIPKKPSGETSVRQSLDGGGVEVSAGLANLAAEVKMLTRVVRAQMESLQRQETEFKSEISTLRSESRWSMEGTAALGSMLEGSLRPQLERSLDQSVRSSMDRVRPVVEGMLEEHCRELRVEHEKFCREGPSGVCWDTLMCTALANGLEPLRAKLASEAAAQAEAAAREGVALALQRNSKMLVDSIAGNLLITLRPAMLETFRNALSAVVLPSFEKSCSHMFQQINDAFSHGTKEYVRVLEAHFERRWSSEKSKEAAAMETIRTEARQLADAIREDVPAQIRKMSTSLAESLGREVRAALEEPLTRTLHEQREWMEGSLTKSLRSVVFSSPANVPPMTPDSAKRLVPPTAPSPLPVSPNGAILMRSRISDLLTQGRVNEAFQMALSASDLGLVTYLCELTSPAQVFGGTSVMGGGGGKCKLEQPVLLSLVQQLSANLFDYTELKMSYLTEAVFHLDMRQPDLREHLAMVLGVLQKGLNSYVISHPGSKLAKEMRMLLMTSACMMEFAKSQPQMPSAVTASGYSFRDRQSSVSLVD
ncbi:enhancer of mRNA-decapping protein 4 isoform X2 [Ischnura elegans]|uniref:enhancer of mRNA-decapping protein 4 isoform X2 n=1 Tax=Ischnura elegans TaxID=197161 RepID=UPI001ED87D48|nr:enhancer of mRNA-decapping protein 4 isoform X2 [Ischnura elegans]